MLEQCLKSANNADIVWFDFRDTFDDIEPYDEVTWLDLYHYTQNITISNLDWIKRSKDNKIQFYSCPIDKLINFNFFKTINLCFLEGIVSEDVLFAELLFAQANSIAILPQNLYIRRVRKNSTTTTIWDNAKTLPMYIKPLNKTFLNNKEAYNYFGSYSWCKISLSLVEFANNYPNKQISTLLMKTFLSHYLGLSRSIFQFTKDPYHIKGKIVQLLKNLNPNSPYLPKRMRGLKYYIYSSHILSSINQLKIVERKFRHWRKGLFDKANK